jgi:hypothetical protein
VWYLGQDSRLATPGSPPAVTWIGSVPSPNLDRSAVRKQPISSARLKRQNLQEKFLVECLVRFRSLELGTRSLVDQDRKAAPILSHMLRFRFLTEFMFLNLGCCESMGRLRTLRM